MRMRYTTLLALGSAGLLVLCGACGPTLSPAAGPRPPSDASASGATLASVEDEVLRELAATDRRVGVRGQIEARDEDLRKVTMGALLAEDPTLAAVDGAIDPFSFEGRARGLEAVKATLAHAPAAVPSSNALERELLGRLVDEESVRLLEERALPRSASALVRGIVETWTPPTKPQQAGERDRWLTRRLGEVRSSVDSPGGLDVVRARELDDALDALERAMEAAGLGRATAELVQLREALEAQASRPAAKATSSWIEVERGERAHLGLALGPEALEPRLATVEKTLRAAAEGAITNAHLRGDDLASHAATLVFAPPAANGPPCSVAIPSSRLRSMAPPPERASPCVLRKAALAAGDERSRAFVLVALHDHVVVAQWALDVARGASTLAETTGRHRPLSQPAPDVVARWERVAIVQPVAALGGGIAAELLDVGGDVEGRARAWALLGDVPFDIAERELRAARP